MAVINVNTFLFFIIRPPLRVGLAVRCADIQLDNEMPIIINFVQIMLNARCPYFLPSTN